MPHSDTNEAVAIASALRPTVDEWERESSRSCVRMKKMTVATVYNSSTRTIGVREAFSATAQNVPCVPGMRGASVGDPVWVQWLYGDKSTMCVVGPGDVSEFYDGGTNPNILDNWCFDTPINQRGQNSYTGVGYSIDRWKIYHANMAVGNTNGHYLILQANNAVPASNRIFYQQIENPSLYAGKTLTYSVLTHDSCEARFWIIIRYIKDGTVTLKGTIVPTYEGRRLYSLTTDIPSDITDLMVTFQSTTDGIASGKKIRLLAAKLEVGSEQTLAYYDGSEWKLRELPEYTEQLSRCQRYFYRINRPVEGTNTIALAQAYNTSQAVAVMPIPHMREITSVTTSNTFKIINNNGTTLNVSSYGPKNSNGGVECSIDITAASASLTKGNVYILVTNGAGYMDFNADL